MFKLFCFSIAGGSSELFHCIEPYLSREIRMIKLEYAGHGIRMREPFYTDVDALVEDMYSMIRDDLKDTDEYMLFGYSMGCIALSATLAEIISREELPIPRHVFLAAHIPGVSGKVLSDEELENDDAMKSVLIQFGGIPQDIASSAIFWKLYMPIYKADYRLMRSYSFDKLRLKTDISTDVFLCEDDTSYDEMQKWKKFYVGELAFHSFIGGHFFVKSHAERIAEIISERAL